MMTYRALWLASWLVAVPCFAGPQAPYIPLRDDIVLQTVPSITDPRVRAFTQLRTALAQRPQDMTRAVKLSEAYLDYGRDTGDARYLGRAEAVVAPWMGVSPVPIPVLLLHATILQSRHYFAEAQVQLRSLLQRESDNSQAWLTLATVAQVQGDMGVARRACARLLDSSDPLIPGGCLASLDAADGHAATAYRLLSVLSPQARAEPIGVQSWIRGILADSAKYLGNDVAADEHFRMGLQLTPGDNFLLADYADFLLDEKRPQAALELVRDYSQSDTSFLRPVYAEVALGAPHAAADTAQMTQRFAALELRGSRTYRREQAGFVLRLEHRPQRALELAQENWSVQRAPEDMRVFLEAALAAKEPQKARPVLDQLAQTHLEYPVIAHLAAQVRAALARTPAGNAGDSRSARRVCRRACRAEPPVILRRAASSDQQGSAPREPISRRWLFLLALLIVALPAPAWAHKESDAYVTLRTNRSNPNLLNGQFDVALRDLDFAIGVDSNHDGAITWGEVKAHREAIECYVLPTLTIKGDGLTCPITPMGQMVDEHSDGAYDVAFKALCNKEVPARLTVVYRLFEHMDPYHRGIITVYARGQTSGAVLGPDSPSTTLDINRPDRWRQFRSFVIDGICHIWTGPDHLLFILSLLFPSVLICIRRPRTPLDPGIWAPAERFWPATLELVKVISGFTVSHSVTLSLSVLGFIDLPSRLVESGIALSVIAAAFNNIYPIVTRRAWVVAFAFGFIHGLGFASALAGLSLPPVAMAASLGGFNVGVEIGQESVVLPLILLAFALRETWFYKVGVMRVGSCAIILVAAMWLVERVFDVLIPGLGFLTPS